MTSYSRNLDLNLLKTFVVTYKEQNLKKAAKLLSCTPPAVSIKLSKLRDHFGQTLFIKVPTGLEPTPFADELFQSVEPLLHALESKVLHVGGFDPVQINDTIKLTIGRQLLPWLAPKLFKSIQKQAPRSSSLMNLFGTDAIERIKKGELDIGIEYKQLVTKELTEVPLGNQSLKFVVRKEHPFQKEKARIKELAQYDFAFINNAMEPDAPGIALFRELQKQNTPVRVKFSSLSSSATLNVVLSNNLVCPVPENLYNEHRDRLRVIDVTDITLHHAMPVYGYLHQKNRHSAKHLWLLELIRNELSLQQTDEL